MNLPSGTVTFLFTDVESSTKLWENYPEAMRQALARHDALAEETLTHYEGILVKSRGEGDSVFGVFARATDAITAACALQQAFVAEPWSVYLTQEEERRLSETTDGVAPAPPPFLLRVRMALHTGEADLRDADYYGQSVNRCARLRAIAHGGQILLSATTQELVRDSLPEGADLLDLQTHKLRDLNRPEQVFQLLHPALPAEFPALRSLNNPQLPNNLPQQVTSFVGREKEIAEIKSLLGKTRLLTLTGSGGAGKTRLSLQVGAEMLTGDDDGVWLVELAPITDPGLVPQTVATALGVREEPGKLIMQTLTEYLSSRNLLLILDNCEHLLEASATLVDTLLRHCPNILILASSREGLGIAGETTYRIPSLSLPDPKQPPTPESLPQYEAVRLFIERAQAAQPSFTVTNQNAPALAEVCYRLDGIPLAIELAAARIRAMSVEQIAQRLGDRFRLLTGGSRTALPRQQTLRALIDWSYDLLSDKEKALLCRLSVFAGGWTLEAAEKVCSDKV